MESTLEKNKTVAIHLNQIRVSLNIRYGWESDKILDAYDAGIEELKTSIATWGFKYNEPLEIFDSGEVDENGLVIYDLGEGHRRRQAAFSLWSENNSLSLGDGLQPGEVWCYISEKPKDILDLLASQFDANKTQHNTKMDIAKAVDVAFANLPGKKSEKLEKIGQRLGGMTRQTAETYFNVFQLPSDVKDWIQQSELNPDQDITLSFSTAGEITNYYKVGDASKLLLEALKRSIDSPESVDTFGTSVTRKWLHELAVELKLGKEPPKKEVQKPVIDSTTQESISSPPVPSSSIDIELDKKESTTELQASADIHPVTPVVSESPIKTASEKSVKQKETPIERIETQLLKLLISEAGDYIVDGKSDVDAGKFIIELPVDVGERLAELIAAIIDPKSNPASDVLPIGLVSDEYMEF